MNMMFCGQRVSKVVSNSRLMCTVTIYAAYMPDHRLLGSWNCGHIINGCKTLDNKRNSKDPLCASADSHADTKAGARYTVVAIRVHMLV